MTRRLTISGARSEMGLVTDMGEPETPPPVWTPAKSNDFWRKPSRWQICMPRLRLVAKVVLSLTMIVLVYKFLNPTYIPPPSEPILPPTEDEMKEAAAKEDWIWKDYPR